MSKPTVVDADRQLDPSTLTFYRVLEEEAAEIVERAFSLRDRLTALDEQTDGHHPTVTDEEHAVLRRLTGSRLAWATLLDGLSGVVYS